MTGDQKGVRRYPSGLILELDDVAPDWSLLLKTSKGCGRPHIPTYAHEAMKKLAGAGLFNVLDRETSYENARAVRLSDEKQTLWLTFDILRDWGTGLPTPDGKRNWSAPFIRGCISDDVYKPHTYQEVEPLVSAEVATRLDPEKRYGIWWFNRERVTYTQVAENGIDGERHYRRRAKHASKPRSEWIAMPVPNPGISREWVDAAREATGQNKRTSKNGGRFWELTGGILHCACCGWSMSTTTVKTRGSFGKPNHYYRCQRPLSRVEGCENRKTHRADVLEPRVWEFVSGLLKDPERLRTGLAEMIERESDGLPDNADQEAKAWRDRLAEVDYKRARFQDMAAEGLIDFDELRAKLVALKETRDTTRTER